MDAIREKRRGASQLARHRHLLCSRVAEAVEASPAKARDVALRNLDRILLGDAGLSHARPFAAAWRRLLAHDSLQSICELLRDKGEATEQMRICQPFAGLLSVDDLRDVSQQAYGTSESWRGRAATKRASER